jgi:hypothetical protein
VQNGESRITIGADMHRTDDDALALMTFARIRAVEARAACIEERALLARV